MSVMDSRRLPRAQLAYYMPVHELESGEEVGRIVDITPEGLRLVCEAPIEEDEDYMLVLETQDDNGVIRRLELETVSVWCRPDTNSDFFAAGFQIIGYRCERGYSIDRFVHEFGMREAWSDDELVA